MKDLFAVGLGWGTPDGNGGWLEAWYPWLFQPDAAATKELAAVLGDRRGLLSPVPGDLAEGLVSLARQSGQAGLAGDYSQQSGHRQALCCALEADAPIASTAEAYLKLHLLSARLARPNSLNLEGIFAHLPTLAWTGLGPLPPEEVGRMRLVEQSQGRMLWTHSVDKFPPLTQYLIPPGVRIADTARVRLGAWIGEGTTIMHEGFVNFNAGTEGAGMIEGRISAGVIVGEGSDLGGGASTMGRLSGGGQELVSIGRDCLVGANAGLGMPLGDRCTVEAGLYLTAGAKVLLLDGDGAPTGECRARQLAGKSDLLFWRNSLTGAVECRSRRRDVALNPDLHDHN